VRARIQRVGQGLTVDYERSLGGHGLGVSAGLNLGGECPDVCPFLGGSDKLVFEVISPLDYVNNNEY
jgi:fructose-1-phosphate kinase PfkB-like protein